MKKAIHNPLSKPSSVNPCRNKQRGSLTTTGSAAAGRTTSRQVFSGLLEQGAGGQIGARVLDKLVKLFLGPLLGVLVGRRFRFLVSLQDAVE